MGCVFGREVAASDTESHARREKVPVKSDQVGVHQNGESKKETQRQQQQEQNQRNVEGNHRQRGERRRSLKPNPRLSNPPKNVHGEQVAAGWPSWLSAVAGEAINGWTPRRADSFEKLDKVFFAIYVPFGLVNILGNEVCAISLVSVNVCCWRMC